MARQVAGPVQALAYTRHGPEISTATKRLSESGLRAFGEVVNEQDGDAQLALELAQEAEEYGEFLDAVFVRSEDADQRIENEEPGLDVFHGGPEAGAVVSEVQLQDGGNDEVEVQGVQSESAVCADAGQALVDLSPHLPDEALLGLHLCYGDLGHRHFKEPKDLALVVRMANAGVAAIRRPVDFVHMPVPRNRSDDAYFAPLADLTISDTKLFLGLMHHTDGVQGTLQRLETAQKHASGFGIATECGFGRRPPETIPELMRIHREAAARL